jgi:hypothetical protein
MTIFPFLLHKCRMCSNEYHTRVPIVSPGPCRISRMPCFSSPLTVSSFRKQTTPFSITVSTPTCDLINIYTLSLPQGRGVRDVVILLIGATPPLSSAPRITVLELTTLPPCVAQTCQLALPPLDVTRTSDELNGRGAA